MHRTATTLLLALGFAAASVTVARAQVFGYGYGAPSGSYQRSCSNAQMRGNVLTAACTNDNGQSVWSSLDVSRCSGDIANYNGHLTCPGAYNNGGYGYNNGGYGRGRDDDDNDDNGRDRDHGRGNHRDRGRGNGGYNNGRGPGNGGYGYNNGGYNGGYGYGLPPGSYQQSCQNARMNGSMLSASCTAVNGAWINSSLDLRRCNQGADIYNRNGRLGCY